MDTEALQKRLYWRSRRGMVELDLRLVPFVTRHYANLNGEDQAAYAALLEHEDWQIFDWLQGREHPEDPAIERIVAAIRSADGG